MPRGRSAKRVFALDIPGIHVLGAAKKEVVDGRDKPGLDGFGPTNERRIRLPIASNSKLFVFKICQFKFIQL
jgi:hypothetical protein